MTQTRPKIIGFDEPISTAERVSELLHAARAAIIPPSGRAARTADEADGEERQSAEKTGPEKTGPEQILHALDQIARSLRGDDDLDRPALAAALDGVREALTGVLGGRWLPTSAEGHSPSSSARIPARSAALLGATYDILQPEMELPHAVIEEARG